MDEKGKKTIWLIDPVHTKIRFETKYLLITSVSGWFSKFEGTVITSGSDFSNSQVRLTIYTHSLNTGNQERDKHLRSADFFDAKRFPTLSFTSSSVTVKDSRVQVNGELYIRGIKENISFEAIYTGSTRDDMGNTKAGFEMTTMLNRKDFGISWNRFFDPSGVLLSDEVNVYGDIQLLKVS